MAKTDLKLLAVIEQHAYDAVMGKHDFTALYDSVEEWHRSEVLRVLDALSQFMFRTKEAREVYCPKEDRRIKEYFSHHDLDHYCENCGTKLKERTVTERDWSGFPEQYEIEEKIAGLRREYGGKESRD